MKKFLVSTVLGLCGSVLASCTPAFSQSIETIYLDDWRTANNLPYSTPVLVEDPFSGSYLAVFDVNFTGNLQFAGWDETIASNWSRDVIRVYAYRRDKICNFWSCRYITTVYEARSLDIRIGGEIFMLEGSDGNFPTTPELRVALSSAPEAEAKIRLQLEGSGSNIVSDIGLNTVRAWQTIYGGGEEESLTPEGFNDFGWGELNLPSSPYFPDSRLEGN